MVGLGIQGDLDAAREFALAGGVTFTMLWDGTSATWAALGITAPPAAILYDGDGTVLGQWSGRLDEAEVADLIRSSSQSNSG